MTQKQLWLLTGGNGAGKSTFYQTQLAPLGLPFVNADIIARELFPESPEERSYDAALIAEDIRNGLLREGRSFCFETVFSHPSKIDFVGRALALGYQIILVFIHLEQAELNKARVAQRVEQGGHNVPDDKIEERIPRVLENIKTAIPLCEQVRVLDNSYADDPYKAIMTLRKSVLEAHVSPLPDWAQGLIG